MYFINLLFILLSLNVSAQALSVARYCAMGNTGIALQGLESLSANAAGLAALDQSAVALYYQGHYVANTRTQGLLMAIPTHIGTFGVYLNQYGISGVYVERTVGATYAISFGQRLYTALTLNYHQLRITNYDSKQTYSVDVGLQYRIQDNWWVGAKLANPGYAAYDDALYAVIPVQLSFGTSYRVHQGLLLTGDMERLLYRKKTDVRTGLEYQLASWIYFRGGLGFDEFSQFCGLGLRHRKMTFDLATIIHPQLGFAPQLFLAYAF
ncbi:hypothetical protein GCM10023231_39250 [Olivibacter ginsenosidimutans]|uniref:PorT family protein n=1 Tax=Olivibacter ginsenosidimutans TaxID=1176537 RepID=A0ABP9C894_9SPHI